MKQGEITNHLKAIEKEEVKKFINVRFTVENDKSTTSVSIYSSFRSNIPLSLIEQIIDANVGRAYSDGYKYANDLSIISYSNSPNSKEATFLNGEEKDAFNKRNKIKD